MSASTWRCDEGLAVAEDGAILLGLAVPEAAEVVAQAGLQAASMSPSRARGMASSAKAAASSTSSSASPAARRMASFWRR